jgi:hypothetical protein
MDGVCGWDECISTNIRCSSGCVNVFDYSCVDWQKYIDVCSVRFGGVLFGRAQNEKGCEETNVCEQIWLPDWLCSFYGMKKLCVNKERKKERVVVIFMICWMNDVLF